MKKKWFVLLSVGILLLASFAGCSQADPKELYQGAVDKMNELEEIDMEMNMDMMNGMCMLMCRSFPCAKN